MMCAIYGAWILLVIISVAITFAQHGPGFMGCYPSGKHLQGLFTTGYMSQSLDECRDNCSIDGRSYAAISESTCFCSDDLPMIQKSEDTQCNSPCTGNINQTCGSRTHYSIYSAARGQCPQFTKPTNGRVIGYRLAVGSIVTFSCFQSFELIGPTSIRCIGSVNGSGKPPDWSEPVPTCVLKSTATATKRTTNASMISAAAIMEYSTITGSTYASDEKEHEEHHWIIIKVGSGLVGLCLIILLICAVVKYVRRKQRQDLTARDSAWTQPKNLGQRINVPSTLPLTGLSSTEVRGECVSNVFFTRKSRGTLPDPGHQGTVSSGMEGHTYGNINTPCSQSKGKRLSSNPFKSHRHSRNIPQAEENYVNYVPKRGRINMK